MVSMTTVAATGDDQLERALEEVGAKASPRVPAELRRPSQKQILNYTVHNEVIGIFYSSPSYWRGANGPDADEIRHLVLVDGPDR